MTYHTLTVVAADRDGLSIASADLTQADAGGEQFENDGRTILVLENTNGSARTATVLSAMVVDGALTVADVPITLPATSGKILTTFWPMSIYNQIDRKVRIDFSAITGVKVAAVRLPREIAQ